MNGPATSLRYLGNAEVEHTVKAIIHYQLMAEYICWLREFKDKRSSCYAVKYKSSYFIARLILTA